MLDGKGHLCANAATINSMTPQFLKCQAWKLREKEETKKDYKISLYKFCPVQKHKNKTYMELQFQDKTYGVKTGWIFWGNKKSDVSDKAQFLMKMLFAQSLNEVPTLPSYNSPINEAHVQSTSTIGQSNRLVIFIYIFKISRKKLTRCLRKTKIFVFVCTV